MSASLNITAHDIATIQQVGHDSIVAIVALVVEAVLYTIYAILVGVAGYILLSRTRTRPSAILFGIILLMFLLETALWIIDIHTAIAEISFTLTPSTDQSFTQRILRFYGLSGGEVIAAVYAFMSNLGDIIIIWRVHAFWSHGKERLVLLIPISLLMASFVTSALLSDCASRFGPKFYAVTYGNYVNPPFCKSIQRVSFLTAFLTTVVSTLLILYKTWQYRRSIRSHLKLSTTRQRIENIMIIFVESGLLYSLFFLAAYVDSSSAVQALKNSTVGSRFASVVWQYQTSKIVGIYPAIIVILVHTQRSYVHATTMVFSSVEVTQLTAPSALTWDSTHQGSRVLIGAGSRGTGADTIHAREAQTALQIAASRDNSEKGELREKTPQGVSSAEAAV